MRLDWITEVCHSAAVTKTLLPVPCDSVDKASHHSNFLLPCSVAFYSPLLIFRKCFMWGIRAESPLSVLKPRPELQAGPNHLCCADAILQYYDAAAAMLSVITKTDWLTDTCRPDCSVAQQENLPRPCRIPDLLLPVYEKSQRLVSETTEHLCFRNLLEHVEVWTASMTKGGVDLTLIDGCGQEMVVSSFNYLSFICGIDL